MGIKSFIKWLKNDPEVIGTPPQEDDVASVPPLWEKMRAQMLPLSEDGAPPEEDGRGNSTTRTFSVTIAGTTHLQGTCNPQDIIPQLQTGEMLVLVPDPENQYDSEAIMVMTSNYSRIGWIPRDHPEKPFLFRRLIEGYPVCAVFFGSLGLRSGVLSCMATITTYGTPFQPSLKVQIQEQKEAELKILMRNYLTLVNEHDQLLRGKEKEYVDTVKAIISAIPNSEQALKYITYEDHDQYFDICCLGDILVRLNLQGRKQYWLFPMGFAEFNRRVPATKIKCEPATKKEGSSSCRLLITQASDLAEFHDTIKQTFLNHINHKSLPPFPELV